MTERKTADVLFSILSSICTIAAILLLLFRVFSAPHAPVEVGDLFALLVVIVNLLQREARE